MEDHILNYYSKYQQLKEETLNSTEYKIQVQTIREQSKDKYELQEKLNDLKETIMNKYSLTLNSVQDDLTMFARRVHEINSSNILTLSNYSKGIANIFNDTIYFIEKDNDWKKFSDLLEIKDNSKYNLLIYRK